MIFVVTNQLNVCCDDWSLVPVSGKWFYLLSQFDSIENGPAKNKTKFVYMNFKIKITFHLGLITYTSQVMRIGVITSANLRGR